MSVASDPVVYLVDDDAAALDSIAALLTVCGFVPRTFSSGQQFLASARGLPPGCVVSDVRMPELDGLAMLEQLNRLKLPFAVVFVTGHGDIRTAVRAIRAGAVDFVEKPIDGGVLVNAIRIAQEELTGSGGQDIRSESSLARLAQLTPREKDVFARLVAGMPNKVIAQDLGISPRTVEFHRSRVMAKMHARSLSALIRLGLAAGLGDA